MPRTRANGSATPRRGRPRVHGETWSKVSVVLFDRQIVQLDRLLTDIRAHTKVAINRAGLIRGLIDGFLDSRIDMRRIKSEKELRTRISRCLRSQA